MRLPHSPSLLTLVALGLGACTLKKSGTNAQSLGDAPTLNSLSDSELFRSNSNVMPNLQQEVKRQFLAAVGISGVLREFAGSNGDIILNEIGIAKTENSKLVIDFMADGKVQTKRAPVTPGETADVAGPTPLGVNVSSTYNLVTSTYNVSLAFQDRATSEVFRFHLTKPLEVEELMKVTSRVKISFNAIKALPPQVGTIVARFLDDISLSIDSGVSWERSSELSTRMFYRDRQHGATELMRDFAAEVIRPLCATYAQRRGKPTSICAVDLSPAENPVAELARPRVVGGCEKTGMMESLFPIYKFYVPVPKGAQIYRMDDKAYLFEAVRGGWQRVGWVTIVGEVDAARCPGSNANNSVCLVAKYGQHWFDNRCKAPYAQPTYALSPDGEAQTLYN